jgi:RecB family exonuclease
MPTPSNNPEFNDLSQESLPSRGGHPFTDNFANERLTRIRNLYSPEIKEYPLSRSKLETYLKCPTCFYRDRREGVSPPPPYPYSLNSAVDELLKREFDQYREQQKPHPLMIKAGIEAVPLKHPNLDEWRDSLHKGIKATVPGTNFRFSGGVDDLWINSKGEIHVVDYKSTASKKEVSMEDEYKDAYKRQVEMYQWLFKANGFNVSDITYFVYCNADLNRPSFDSKLEFNIAILEHKGDYSWVDKALKDAHACLGKDTPPPPCKDCDHCKYIAAVDYLSGIKRKH